MADESNPGSRPVTSAEHIDDLFDYDVGLDGILQEISTTSANINAPNPSLAPKNPGVVLGLDEEVKVTKKRQPVAKLDESRLLSQAGIPKLRRSAKQKLKLKGKGHEFSDLARILNFYQLWLDDLFPRAKFADGLTMIERLGHSKRLQTMRREWIDEEKPKTRDDDISDHPQISGETSGHDIIASNDVTMTDSHEAISPDQMEVEHALARPRPSREMDDLDQELFISDGNNQQPSSAHQQSVPQDDEFDELDALLREQEDEETGAATKLTSGAMHDSLDANSDADELEAMEGLGTFGDIIP